MNEAPEGHSLVATDNHRVVLSVSLHGCTYHINWFHYCKPAFKGGMMHSMDLKQANILLGLVTRLRERVVRHTRTFLH